MTLSWTGREQATRRLSKAEIENRLLETAKTLIRSNGLTVSLEHLRLDELMELANVPKTSFYRVWDSKDAFFVRLLEELVQPEGGVGAAYDPETLEIVRNVVREHQHLLGDAEGRRRVLTEAVRQGAEQNFTSVRDSKSWQTYMAVLAALPGVIDMDDRTHIQSALQVAENYFIDRMAAFYEELLPVFGYRFREGITARHVAAAGAAVVEGLIQRYVVSPELVDTPVPGPSIDGGVAKWHLAAVGFLGVIQVMIEPLEASGS